MSARFLVVVLALFAVFISGTVARDEKSLETALSLGRQQSIVDRPAAKQRDSMPIGAE